MATPRARYRPILVIALFRIDALYRAGAAEVRGILSRLMTISTTKSAAPVNANAAETVLLH
jgi:hypothetical protein